MNMLENKDSVERAHVLLAFDLEQPTHRQKEPCNSAVEKRNIPLLTNTDRLCSLLPPSSEFISQVIIFFNIPVLWHRRADNERRPSADKVRLSKKQSCSRRLKRNGLPERHMALSMGMAPIGWKHQ